MASKQDKDTPWLIFVAGTHKRNTGCSAEEVFRRLLRQLCRQKAKDKKQQADWKSGGWGTVGRSVVR